MNSFLKIKQMLAYVITLTTSRRQFKGGFSLVEVVVSIGIVSFAILSVFALLPVGLATFHNSSEIYFSSQARQQILNNLQQANVSTLLNGTPSYTENDYFDGEGSFLGTNTATLASPPIYQVVVTLSLPSAPATAATPLTLPNAIAPSVSLDTLAHAVFVTTQFSRYKGNVNNSTGASTYQTGTDYLYLQTNIAYP